MCNAPSYSRSWIRILNGKDLICILQYAYNLSIASIMKRPVSFFIMEVFPVLSFYDYLQSFTYYVSSKGNYIQWLNCIFYWYCSLVEKCWCLYTTIGLLMRGTVISEKVRMRRLVAVMNAIYVVLAATKHMATANTLVRVKWIFCPDLYLWAVKQ